MVLQICDTPSRLLLVIDMNCWQAGQLNAKNAIKALDAILKHVYHTLGKTGAEVDRRCIILKLVAGSEDVDGSLERFEGVQLVGPGRAVGDAEAAVIAASKSQALVGCKIVAVVASDRLFGDDDSVLHRIGSIPTFLTGHILTWQYKEKKGSVEISVDSIKKVENDSAEPAAEENSPPTNQDHTVVDDVLLGGGTVLTDAQRSPCQESTEDENAGRRVEQSSPALGGAFYVMAAQGLQDIPDPSILDFVPLVKTLRCYENDLSSKQKPTRGQAAQELLANYSWPIGEGGYRTFRHYSGAAETAGFVFLGTCKFGPTIRSTGRLESLLNIKPAENYTEGWPRVH